MKSAALTIALCLAAGAWAQQAPAPAPSAPYMRPLNQDCVTSVNGSSPAASLNYFPSPFRITGYDSTNNGQVTVTVAKDFSVQYFDNYKVVTNSLVNETYVLYQCGTPPPASNSLPAGAKLFSLPLTSTAVLDTVPVAFLNELGVMSRVQSVSSYTVNSCGQKLLACGKSAPVSSLSATAAGLEAKVAPVADAAVLSSAVPSSPIAVAFSAASDPGPLNRAEWLKFLGLFYNLDAVATQLFDSINASYYQTRAQVAAAAAARPVLAFTDLYTYPPDAAFEVSLAPYKLNYTTDAGATPPSKAALLAINGTQLAPYDTTNSTVWFAWNRTDGTGFPSRAAAAAAFQSFLKGVDIIVDETYALSPSAYNMSTFLANYGLNATSSFSFLANKTVYREDGLISPTDGLDWFEGAIARPDKVLQDFAWAVAPSQHQGYTPTWLRNIAAGQNVTVVSSQNCNQLSACGQAPTPICPFVRACGSGAPAIQQSVNSTCQYVACSS